MSIGLISTVTMTSLGTLFSIDCKSGAVTRPLRVIVTGALCITISGCVAEGCGSVPIEGSLIRTWNPRSVKSIDGIGAVAAALVNARIEYEQAIDRELAQQVTVDVEGESELSCYEQCEAILLACGWAIRRDSTSLYVRNVGVRRDAEHNVVFSRHISKGNVSHVVEVLRWFRGKAHSIGNHLALVIRKDEGAYFEWLIRFALDPEGGIVVEPTIDEQAANEIREYLLSSKAVDDVAKTEVTLVFFPELNRMLLKLHRGGSWQRVSEAIPILTSIVKHPMGDY